MFDQVKEGAQEKKILKSYYYHIARDFDSWLKIGREGLKASTDGYIYLLTTKDVALYVAVNQLCILDDYGLVKIDPKGITGVVEDDNVAEITACYQKRVKQALIESKYIKRINMYHILDPGKVSLSYLLQGNLDGKKKLT